MLAWSREAKLSRSKRIKVHFFPGGKTEDFTYYHLIITILPYLKKEPDNIIIHIGTNYSSNKMEVGELVTVKETTKKFHPNSKNIVMSSPIVQTDKNEANSIVKKYKTFWNKKKGMSFLTATFQHGIYTEMVCT